MGPSRTREAATIFPLLPDTRTIASTRRRIAMAVIAVSMIDGLSGCFGFGPSPILAAIGRGTEDMRLGSMDLLAKDPEGQDVSLASAAGELGLKDAVQGKSLGLL